jgi:hypothetical protein
MMGQLPPDQNTLFYDFCLENYVPHDHARTQQDTKKHPENSHTYFLPSVRSPTCNKSKSRLMHKNTSPIAWREWCLLSMCWFSYIVGERCFVRNASTAAFDSGRRFSIPS